MNAVVQGTADAVHLPARRCVFTPILQQFDNPVKIAGSIPNLVPGIVQLLLFKEWGHGIETMSNDEASR